MYTELFLSLGIIGYVLLTVVGIAITAATYLGIPFLVVSRTKRWQNKKMIRRVVVVNAVCVFVACSVALISMGEGAIENIAAAVLWSWIAYRKLVKKYDSKAYARMIQKTPALTAEKK